MVTLRLFASVREIAGQNQIDFHAQTVGEVIQLAVENSVQILRLFFRYVVSGLMETEPMRMMKCLMGMKSQYFLPFQVEHNE